jgi:hypothetical protein
MNASFGWDSARSSGRQAGGRRTSPVGGRIAPGHGVLNCLYYQSVTAEMPAGRDGSRPRLTAAGESNNLIEIRQSVELL